MAGTQIKHDFYIVSPSAWPLISSVSACVMMLGAVAWMKSGAGEAGLFGIRGPYLFIAGFVAVLVTMAGWFRDIVHESLTGKNTSTVVRLGARYGMVLFIASEVMFFAAWFWAFFGAALFPGGGDAIILPDGSSVMNADGNPAFLGNDGRMHATDGMWPPAGVTPLSPWGLPLINTLILLLSGTTVTWAHHALLEGNRKGLVLGLLITIALGIVFSCIQAYEYYEAIHYDMFAFSGGGIYGAAFFMATGFHGLHVFIGTVFLVVCLFRALAGHFTPDRHFGFEAAAWYWHFVDVVWLFLFVFVYVLGNNGLLS